MKDEDFIIGNSEENVPEDFILGDFDQSISQTKLVQKDNDEFLHAYNLLKIDDKKNNDDYEEYFKSNVDIFTVVGKKPYEVLSNLELNSFIETCVKWEGQASAKWGKQIQNERKIDEFHKALNALQRIFSSPEKTESYSVQIKDALRLQLNGSYEEKIKDNLLEISEIQELIDSAFTIRLITNESEKTEIISWIKDKCKKDNCRIESYVDTFIRLVKNKSAFERFDTDECKQNLFKEYKKLRILDLQVNNLTEEVLDKELYEEMYNLLIKNKLLVDNLQYYYEKFFRKEIETEKYNFSLQLNNEYYYYLKGTAVHNYQFSEMQWDNFVHDKQIKKEDDASIAFIMGTEKASTISDIADLIISNPNIALSRILAGDLETYLEHIKQRELAKKISEIKNELKNEQNILVESVANLLKGVDGSASETLEGVDRQNIFDLISNNATPEKLVSYMLKRKTKEKLSQRIIYDSKEHTALSDYLISKGYSFTKICMNYLHQFPQESNASEYTNIYELYACYVLNQLKNEKDSLTFNFVFKPILSEVDKTKYLSKEFQELFNSTEEEMKEIILNEQNKYKIETNVKSKRKLFKF